MCMIVDADCARHFCLNSQSAGPIRNWLKKTSSHIAVGGTQLRAEYKKVSAIIELLAALDTRGQVRRFDDDEVDSQKDVITHTLATKSNDVHIIALAIVSGSRLLYSHDHKLHADFTNRAIIEPRGHVYQNYTHEALLRSAPPCVD